MDALAAASVFGKRPADPEQEFFGRLIDDRVVNAIEALPKDFRDVLVLSDFGDLAYGEIAHVLDIPVGTPKGRLVTK